MPRDKEMKACPKCHRENMRKGLSAGEPFEKVWAEADNYVPSWEEPTFETVRNEGMSWGGHEARVKGNVFYRHYKCDRHGEFKGEFVRTGKTVRITYPSSSPWRI